MLWPCSKIQFKDQRDSSHLCSNTTLQSWAQCVNRMFNTRQIKERKKDKSIVHCSTTYAPVDSKRHWLRFVTSRFTGRITREYLLTSIGLVGKMTSAIVSLSAGLSQVSAWDWIDMIWNVFPWMKIIKISLIIPGEADSLPHWQLTLNLWWRICHPTPRLGMSLIVSLWCNTLPCCFQGEEMPQGDTVQSLQGWGWRKRGRGWIHRALSPQEWRTKYALEIWSINTLKLKTLKTQF